MKIVKPIALVLVALLLFTQNVCAKDGNGDCLTPTGDIPISLFWDIASVVSLDLSFSGGKAQCTGRVVGNIGTSKITATFTLERRSESGTYSPENSWNASVDGRTLNFNESCSVSSGYTYRLTITAKVTKDGVTETVTISVENKY